MCTARVCAWPHRMARASRAHGLRPAQRGLRIAQRVDRPRVNSNFGGAFADPDSYIAPVSAAASKGAATAAWARSASPEHITFSSLRTFRQEGRARLLQSAPAENSLWRDWALGAPPSCPSRSERLAVEARSSILAIDRRPMILKSDSGAFEAVDVSVSIAARQW